jgi:hypothetical protein
MKGHSLCAACRHPAVRQRPRRCTEVEEHQGDCRLPARAAERSRQKHQGRKSLRQIISKMTLAELTRELDSG